MSEQLDIRWKQRLANFQSALKQLDDAPHWPGPGRSAGWKNRAHPGLQNVVRACLEPGNPELLAHIDRVGIVLYQLSSDDSGIGSPERATD